MHLEPTAGGLLLEQRVLVTTYAVGLPCNIMCDPVFLSALLNLRYSTVLEYISVQCSRDEKHLQYIYVRS
jgi:hypothetical protein